MTEELKDRREIMAWRKAKRAELIAARMAMPGAAHKAASAALLSRLTDNFLSVCKPVVGFYWPIRRELNPLPFIEKVMAQGAVVALPTIVEKLKPLEFRRWQPGTEMAQDHFGVPYPVSAPAVIPNVLIVPLVGFDRAAYRLGYGAGYYDRTNAVLNPRPLLIGVAFGTAQLETIHPLPHDIPMDHIVTDAEVFSRRRSE